MGYAYSDLWFGNPRFRLAITKTAPTLLVVNWIKPGQVIHGSWKSNKYRTVLVASVHMTIALIAFHCIHGLLK